MKTCTFFGHRDSPVEVLPFLRAVVEEMIETEETEMFYVGNRGRFDEMALLAKKRPHRGHTAQEALEIFQREYLPRIDQPE